MTASIPSRPREPCDNRNPTAAREHHGDAVAQEQVCGGGLDHPNRGGRCDDATPGFTVAGEGPVVLGREGLGLELVVDRAHELGRVGESRVVASTTVWVTRVTTGAVRVRLIACWSQ